MSEAHVAAYRALHGRVSELIAAASPAALEQTAPATPEWTVHDVLAHLVGVTDDVVNGRLDGVASDEWTAAQVDKRRGVSCNELLAEWNVNSSGFEALLGAAPDEIAGQALYDAMTHEQDIRHALGMPGGRDSDAVALAWEWILAMRPLNTEAPTMRFITEHDDVVVGDGDPVASVKASRFELLRASTGRRSAEEIAAYGWEPSAQPELMVVGTGIFRLRPTALNE